MVEEHSEKQALPNRPRRALGRRWWAVILLVALVGAGAVAYLVKVGERNDPGVAKAEAGPAVRAVPVVAVAAKKGTWNLSQRARLGHSPSTPSPSGPGWTVS